jgi:hypothetical protein
VQETTDEDAARVALVADAVSAYLLHVLDRDPAPWQAVQERGDAGSSGYSTASR